MKKKVFIIFCVMCILNVSIALAYGTLYCPRCGLEGIWTGDWTSDAWGIHNIYRCPNGHEFIEGSSDPVIPAIPNYDTSACPYCGLSGIWTGDWTQDGWGIHDIYRCPNGHMYTID